MSKTKKCLSDKMIELVNRACSQETIPTTDRKKIIIKWAKELKTFKRHDELISLTHLRRLADILDATQKKLSRFDSRKRKIKELVSRLNNILNEQDNTTIIKKISNTIFEPLTELLGDGGLEEIDQVVFITTCYLFSGIAGAAAWFLIPGESKEAFIQCEELAISNIIERNNSELTSSRAKKDDFCTKISNTAYSLWSSYNPASLVSNAINYCSDKKHNL